MVIAVTRARNCSLLRAIREESDPVSAERSKRHLGHLLVSVSASTGTLANPVYITRELTLRSLSMTEFCHGELPSNSSPPPTSLGPLRAFIKQWGVRRRRVVGGGDFWQEHQLVA